MNPTRPNTLAAIVAVSWAGSAAFLFVSLQPFLIGAWLTIGLERGEASAALSANHFGALLGNLATIALIAWLRVRTILAAGAVVSAGALALVAALPPQPATLWALLFINGVGGGILAGAAAASAGALPHPGRVFAIIIASQIISGSVALFVVPDILASAGLPALFFGAALLILLTAVWLPFIAEPAPVPAVAPNVPADRPAIWSPAVVLLLVSLGLMYVGNNAVWAYLEQIGAGAGLPASDIGLALAIGQAASLVFAIGAGLFDRWNSAFAISLGTATMAAAALLFIYAPTLAGITLGVAGFLGGVCFLVPFYMSEFARRDQTGRLMVWGQSAITIGLMLGPPWAALIIDKTSMDAMVWSAVALTAAAWATMLQALARRSHQIRAAG